MPPMPTRRGSIHLFRFAGVDLYLHWSWFVVALLEISNRRGSYESITFNVLEYLTLFLIVLLHEFGHALACRSVGGQADEIVLWPLGGVAFVAPPMRPGATLWTIAAGPLVNVLIGVVLVAVNLVAGIQGWAVTPDAVRFLLTIWYINAGLLVFNLLPIYPLDGGQIVRALLWYVIGRARSLMVASVLGLLGVAALLLVAWWQQSLWIGIIALFILANCWRGLMHARQLGLAARLPRRPDVMCPSCQTAPPVGAWWTCSACGKPFDVFESKAVCPHCNARFDGARCLDCGETHPMSEWHVTNPPVA